MRKTISLFTSLGLLLAALSATQISAEPVTLYDGNLRSLPDKQGWIYLLDPILRNNSRQVVVDRAVNLNTLRQSADHAGYFARVPLFTPHPDLPEEFNRERGYQVGFTVQLPTEQHIRPDRAGFSVIVTSRDLMGIELGFWTNEIFAQSVDFIHSEGNDQLPFRLANQYVDFVLEIKGENYTLSSAGTEILTGPLRDYSGFGTPYDISDFLFFGDDTTSASASVNIRSIWIDTVLPGSEPPVVEPEPEPDPEPTQPIVGSDAMFTVDSEASTINITGAVLGNALNNQGNGSLMTSFGGELHTVISESTIAFGPDSKIDANTNGDWAPLPGGKNGSAPADFGAKASVIIATADAAARNIEFVLTSDVIELDADGTGFSPSGITIGIPDGSAAAVDIAVGGFLPVNTSQSLAGLSSENTSSEPATITVADNIQTLTLPIQTEVSFRVATPNDASLTFTGTIIASRELPATVEPPVVEPEPEPEPEPPTPPLPPVVVEPDTAPSLSITLLASGEIQLSWDAVEGRSYLIENSDNLSDWNTKADPITIDSTSGLWTGVPETGVTFYRIILMPLN